MGKNINYISNTSPRRDSLTVAPSFLLVSLNMDAILGEITLTRRRKKLDEMTRGKGLGEAYAATLSRMGAQPRSRSKLGMDVLMWLSHVERPLHVDELCHALGVEGSVDLDIRNIPTIETLLACSLGLITIEKSSSTVRLVHYTLQEYLSYCPNFFPKPHSIIAEVCLTYLNFPHVRGFSPALRSVPPTAPVVEYASCHWATHARRETTENVKALGLKLLDGYDKHISSKLVLMHGVRAEEQPFDREDTPRGFTGLHGGAYLGCPEIIVALLETNKWDVQARDFHGNTAISWAARRGHEEVVRILLERSEVNPNTPDTEYGRVPLSWAAGSGHEGVVKILLGRNDVSPEKLDKSRKSPLYRAAAYGHQNVVRMLLERARVNHNIAETVFGRTLLLWAAEHGHEGIVKILLERNDVDPNKVGYGRKTALWLAANNGHVVVVGLLLERKDVNVNQADSWNRTPLSRAAENGHEGVVRMLLGRDGVSVDEPDNSRGTPLLRAVEGGHVGVAVMLLEQPSVNPNTFSTKYGRTLVSWAAENGHEVIVKTLLAENDVNPGIPDTESGRTPFLWAAENGHEGIVRMFLERNDVNPNTPDTEYGRTPLWCAAMKGHEQVVRMLLQHTDVDPNTPDTECGQAPLWCAVMKVHEEVVRMLLQRTDVDPDTPDAEYGQTPPLWAAGKGHEEVVRTLLERNDVNPNTPDTKYCRTPL